MKTVFVIVNVLQFTLAYYPQLRLLYRQGSVFNSKFPICICHTHLTHTCTRTHENRVILIYLLFDIIIDTYEQQFVCHIMNTLTIWWWWNDACIESFSSSSTPVLIYFQFQMMLAECLILSEIASSKLSHTWKAVRMINWPLPNWNRITVV